MSDDRQAQARAEAERSVAGAYTSEQEQELASAFMLGVGWADDNPQPHTITLAEFEDAYTYWFDGSPSRERAFEFLWALGIKVVDGDE